MDLLTPERSPKAAPHWTWIVLLVWAAASTAGVIWLDWQDALRGILCLPLR